MNGRRVCPSEDVCQLWGVVLDGVPGEEMVQGFGEVANVLRVASD